MSYSVEVAAFVKPAFDLTAAQRSVVGFIDSTELGIASSPRQTGMTFATHAYLVYELMHSTDNNIMVVHPNMQRQNICISELSALMSVVPTRIKPKYIDHNRNAGYIRHKISESTLIFKPMDAVLDALRGRRIDSMIFADFDGYGPYAKKIQQSLSEIMPSLSRAGVWKMHMIGTDGSTYSDTADEKESLMYSALNGKSTFKLWNYKISTMLDELIEM